MKIASTRMNFFIFCATKVRITSAAFSPSLPTVLTSMADAASTAPVAATSGASACAWFRPFRAPLLPAAASAPLSQARAAARRRAAVRPAHPRLHFRRAAALPPLQRRRLAPATRRRRRRRPSRRSPSARTAWSSSPRPPRSSRPLTRWGSRCAIAGRAVRARARVCTCWRRRRACRRAPCSCACPAGRGGRSLAGLRARHRPAPCAPRPAGGAAARHLQLRF